MTKRVKGYTQISQENFDAQVRWYGTPGLKIDVLQLIRTINSNTGLYDIDGLSAALSALSAKIQAESQETLRERDRLLQENLAAQKRAMREETP